MSERFRIVGGAHLKGEVQVPGAKNSVLKLMAASLLAPGKNTITNVPDILDVEIMIELLERLGCKVDRLQGKVEIEVPESPTHRADYELVRKIRASINVLGPLTVRVGAADVALPGGDAIGPRPLDIHIKGLEALGAKVHIEHGYIVTEAPNGLTGTKIELDFPSVGATENIMMAAVLAKGKTVIENAAREPDIVDIGNYLIQMGANISGLGSATIKIEGVTKLNPATHATLPDRIISGTWAFAAAITQGDISIKGARAEDLELPLEKLTNAGAVVTTTEDGIRVRMDHRPKAIDVSTLPYPGFPTDLQPMVVAMNAIAEGDAVVTENVFQGRFMFVNELGRLGAKITVDGHHAAIIGVKQLSGAPVVATDIRAGVGLVLAGLVADGETIVEDAFHIDRGFPNFAEQLQALGGDVKRI
mgnify:FL=1